MENNSRMFVYKDDLESPKAVEYYDSYLGGRGDNSPRKMLLHSDMLPGNKESANRPLLKKKYPTSNAYEEDKSPGVHSERSRTSDFSF
jgi:hypothetical protein